MRPNKLHIYPVFSVPVLLLIGTLLVSSCNITRKYQKPQIDSLDLYRDVSQQDTQSIGRLSWEQVFKDTQLQNLIKLGLEENIDLLVAIEHIHAAEAYYKQSKAGLFPDLNFKADADYSRFEQADVSQYQLGLASTWELDIWGKLSSSKRAQRAALLQTQAAAMAVQTRLVSNISYYYYQLLALDEQLVITEQTIENWKVTVETMRALKLANRVTEAAVVQSEAQMYAAEVTALELKQQIRQNEHALSILLGQTPGPIKRNGLYEQKVLQAIGTGVPAQLLANRPDVQQAELAFRQQYELTNMARAQFYPSLSIRASVGTGSNVLDQLFDPISFLANIGAGLTQPIFNKRSIKTGLEVAKAQENEAYYNFRAALLQAGQEVSDALSLYATAHNKIQVREKQIDALEKSVSYSQELLESGYGNTNYTEVITARQSLLQAELAGINDQFQQLQATVDLYRALGGGWQ